MFLFLRCFKDVVNYDNFCEYCSQFFLDIVYAYMYIKTF